MSIDIDWQRLTTGPDGIELAAAIRDFVHNKFQQVELPRFIRSVHVHTFEFGQECPTVEIKDVCDPWAEFYEDEEDDDEEENEGGDDGKRAAAGSSEVERPRATKDGVHRGYPDSGTTMTPSQYPMAPPPLTRDRPSHVDLPLSTRNLNLQGLHNQPDLFTAPLLSRSSTPGIPGGTSNLSYFHLPLSAGLTSGPQTPLSAAFPPQIPQRLGGLPSAMANQHTPHHLLSRGDSFSNTNPFHPTNMSAAPGTAQAASPTTASTDDASRALDIQTTLHITYSGSVSLSLTAELLLDYPMPSFMGIPLALRITGLTFEGVALLAYIRNKQRENNRSRQEKTGGEQEDEDDDADGQGRGRCQFCFLGEEEGKAVIGDDDGRAGEGEKDDGGKAKAKKHEGRGPGRATDGITGSPLREIHIETAIGRQQQQQQPPPPPPGGRGGSGSGDTNSVHHAAAATASDDSVSGATGGGRGGGEGTGNGTNKPVVLKNVGKVEKFVLEQVRRIFEEEFVWPSFWTFLL